MKKLLVVLLSLILAITLSGLMACGGGAEEEDSIFLFEEVYESNSSSVAGYRVIGVDATALTGVTVINVPEKYKGKPVIEIASGAFSGQNNPAIEEIVEINVPKSVTKIQNGAFTGCLNLQKIVLPFVGESADGTGATYFGHVFGAKSYMQNSSVVQQRLKTVEIIGGENIDDNAFYYCTNLTSIVLHDGVKTVGEKAFHYCSGLTELTIPAGVTEIGAGALYNCKNLESLSVPFLGGNPNDTKNGFLGYVFGAGMYSQNSNYVPVLLKSVNVFGGKIGEGAFYYCSSLMNITLPKGLTEIGPSAFRNCTILNSIQIPDTVTAIGASAFRECYAITQITLPKALTAVGNYAFTDCAKLEAIVFNDPSNWYKTLSQSDFDNKTGGEALDVSNSSQMASALKKNDGKYYLYKK